MNQGGGLSYNSAIPSEHRFMKAGRIWGPGTFNFLTIMQYKILSRGMYA
jgi:hypothetical protein